MVQTINHHESAIHYPTRSRSKRRAWSRHERGRRLVHALEREGVEVVFAYPGGASMELHQSLTKSEKIRTILPRQEQGGGFMAHGYARATGKAGVCMATSGPGATNLVTCIADAYMDSIPLVAITGQVYGHPSERSARNRLFRNDSPHRQAQLLGADRRRPAPRRQGSILFG